MNQLLEKVNKNLSNLIIKKGNELIDLFYNLGYQYENEDITFKTSGWTETQKSLVNTITLLASHIGFNVFWVRMNNNRLNRTEERTIINKLTNEFPYNMVIFSNLIDSEWDFINVKLAINKESEDNKETQKRQRLSDFVLPLKELPGSRFPKNQSPN